jgi:urea transport system substrate-binding protein
VKAVEKAGTFDLAAVIDAMIGVIAPNLSGGVSAMMPNRHITRPVLIGETQGNGQFNIVEQTPGLIVA